MFNQTFVDGTERTSKPYTIVLSLLMQIALLALLVLLPLLYTQVLPSVQLKDMLLAPPPPPAPIPKPIGIRAVRTANVPRVFQIDKLIAPARIPNHIANIDEIPSVPDLGGTTPAGNNSGSIPGLLMGSTPPLAPPAPAVEKPKPLRGPLRVGGNVAEANLIHRVQPAYPALAKSARVQGSVEFTAVISKDGRVENLQLVRGHPLLVAAARDAILQWQYRPTMLNGQPVEVTTAITVNFTLAP